MAPSTKRVMNQVETVKMADIMKQHIRVVGDGMCDYEEGWDDERVAKETSPDLGSNHSSNLRLNLFGKLAQQVASAPQDARIVALEAKVAQLCLLLDKVIKAHDQLCTAITIDQSIHIDARGLKVGSQQ